MSSVQITAKPEATLYKQETCPLPPILNMKPQMLFVTLAVVSVLAALPLAQSEGLATADSATPWPCCDDCGACNRKFPPECFCADASPRGCHPACKQCDESSDNYGSPVFQCMDHITNFCKRRCTAAAELGDEI